MKRLIGFCAGVLFSLSAMAQDVTVSGAWARATAPGQDSASVSLNISSKRDARIVAVSTTVADTAELHTMKHENGMMVMRAVDSMALPAGKRVSLGRGDHIMLVGLKHQLKAGERVPLTLTVEFAGKHRESVAVEAEVRPLTASGAMPMHDMSNMGGMEGMQRGH